MPTTYLAGSAVGTSIVAPTTAFTTTGPAGSPTTLDWVVAALLIAEGGGATTMTTVPAGFITDTVFALEGSALSDGRLRAFYGKFADVGAGPYGFVISGAKAGYCASLAVRGADQTTPLDVASTKVDSTVAATAWAAASQTTVTAGCLNVVLAGCSPGGGGLTNIVTSPFTERLDLENGDALICIGTNDQASAGAIAGAGTISSAEQVAVIQMSFRPAAGAAPASLVDPSRRFQHLIVR